MSDWTSEATASLGALDSAATASGPTGNSETRHRTGEKSGNGHVYSKDAVASQDAGVVADPPPGGVAEPQQDARAAADRPESFMELACSRTYVIRDRREIAVD